MLDLNDYYLGVILAHPSYFINPKSQNRILQDIEADPFQGIPFPQSLVTGVVVRLRRKDDRYYDEDYSRYKNELCYELGKTNSLGIALAYVKPFTECYPEEAQVYIQEKVLEQPEMLEEMALLNSYYIMHSNLTNTDAIVINDEAPMEKVRQEYLEHLITSNQEVSDGKVFRK